MTLQVLSEGVNRWRCSDGQIRGAVELKFCVQWFVVVRGWVHFRLLEFILWSWRVTRLKDLDELFDVRDDQEN